MGAGATAILACSQWLRSRDGLWQRDWSRFKFGNGAVETVHHAAGNSTAVASNMKMLMTFLVDAKMPALLRKSAAETNRGARDFPMTSLRFAKVGSGALPRTNTGGHNVVDVVEFERRAERRPTVPDTPSTHGFCRRRYVTRHVLRHFFRREGIVR